MNFKSPDGLTVGAFVLFNYLPKACKARVCVEAASHFAWYKYSRDYGEVIAMKSFGTSAPAKKTPSAEAVGALAKYFGVTSDFLLGLDN